MIAYNREAVRYRLKLVRATPENVKDSLKWEELKSFMSGTHDDTLLPLPEEDIVIFSSTPGGGKNTFMAFEVFKVPAYQSLYGIGKRPVRATSYHRSSSHTANSYILIGDCTYACPIK